MTSSSVGPSRTILIVLSETPAFFGKGGNELRKPLWMVLLLLRNYSLFNVPICIFNKYFFRGTEIPFSKFPLLDFQFLEQKYLACSGIIPTTHLLSNTGLSSLILKAFGETENSHCVKSMYINGHGRDSMKFSINISTSFAVFVRDRLI